MKKNLLSLFALVLVLLFALTACGKDDKATVTKENIKVGFIFLHDETSTYDNNFIMAAKNVQQKLGLKEEQVILKTQVPENQDCYAAAADLVDQGCDIIFADSFGHGDFMLQAAKEFPNVQFCHATGTKANTENLANFHNAFSSIYEGRYLTGVAAGMKLNEMIENKTITPEEAIIGYVGAYPYAEVISGFTAFYLGAKSVCSTAKMTVRYTTSWYDVAAEKETCQTLINNDKAVIISQHADSQGAPEACESANVPNVFYNGSNDGKKTYLYASRINWEPYFEYMINTVIEGKELSNDWVGTLKDGSVELENLNETLAAKGTKEKIAEVKAKLENGELHVFDCSTFTVKGETLTTYKADVQDFGDFKGETEAVKDGYFHESEYRSAPYFDIIIDGITSYDK